MKIPKTITDHADVIQCDDRQQWLQERSKSIGASDAPAVVNLPSEYGSRTALWADKVRPPVFSTSTEAQEIKRASESTVLSLYERFHGGVVTPWPQTWLARSKAHPYMHATPDGLAQRPDRKGWGVAQVKCWSEFAQHAWSEEPPLSVLVQTQQELACTGLTWGVVVVMFGTQRIQPFYFDRNERFINALIRAASDFWAYVQSQTEPPLDASPATKRALERLHPDDDGLSVLLPDDADTLLDRRARMKRLQRKLGEAVDGIDNQLRAWIGDHSYGITPGGQAASWKSHERPEYTVAAQTIRVLRTCKPPKAPQWSDEQVDYQGAARKRIPRGTKERLLSDDNRCRWCRTTLTMKTATIEHLVPLSRGGTNDVANLALACEQCNLSRGDDATLPAEIIA